MMRWVEPPEPSHGVPDVPHGQIITRDHPAWARRHDPEVWGTLAGAGHNPFHDALRPPIGDWGNGTNERHWQGMREHDPERYVAAHAALTQAAPRLHLAVSVPSHALERIAAEGRVRSVFDLAGAKHWTKNMDAYLPIRRDAEYAHFRYPDQHPGGQRPIYGFLTHDPHGDASASPYGEHTLVLSRARLAHRTSFTGGDSLDDEHMLRAAPLTSPRLHAISPGFAERREHPDAGIGAAMGSIQHRSSRSPYIEAQYHGGVSAADIHYAILRTPHPLNSPKALKANQHLGEHLSAAGIPWVRLDARSGSGEPISWDAGGSRHQGVLMAVHAAVTAGALVADHDPQIHWQQGPDRYLIELTAPGSRGLAMGQIADLEWGRLYPPMPVASILTRGYWEPVEHPVDAEDVLARVRPA